MLTKFSSEKKKKENKQNDLKKHEMYRMCAII